jgi:hypothetical protein
LTILLVIRVYFLFEIDDSRFHPKNILKIWGYKAQKSKSRVFLCAKVTAYLISMGIYMEIFFGEIIILHIGK